MAAGDIITIREGAGGRKGNYYDGVDDYTLHDAHAVARAAAGDPTGTYTAWIYVNDITGVYTILSAGDNNSVNEGFYFAVNAGKLQIFLHDALAVTQFDVIETTAGISAKTWTHVAIRQNGTRPDLFVNGVKSAMTDTTFTDLTPWYSVINGVDKFAIGVRETNATHLLDFKGAIGQVKYWNVALKDNEIMADSNGTYDDLERAATLNAFLQFNITMVDDGTTDAGLGADNGTLTGDAFYGGVISNHSYTVHNNVTGHAAEALNTVKDGADYVTIIKRGD